MKANGFDVEVYDTLEPLERPDDLTDLDLITPICSSACSAHQEEFVNMTEL